MKCYLLANLSDLALNFPKQLQDETKYYPFKKMQVSFYLIGHYFTLATPNK